MKCCADKMSSISLTPWNKKIDTNDEFCGTKSVSRGGKNQCFVDVKPSSTSWTSTKK